MSIDAATPQPEPASDAAALAATLTEEARRLLDLAEQGLAALQTQSRAYAEAAGQQIGQAGEAASGRVRERPLAAMGLALGAGVLIGLILAQGRR